MRKVFRLVGVLDLPGVAVFPDVAGWREFVIPFRRLCLWMSFLCLALLLVEGFLGDGKFIGHARALWKLYSPAAIAGS
jgi:hypothetical protein